MKIQNQAYAVLKEALKLNKFRTITHKEFNEYRQNPMFMYVGNYVSREWDLVDGEVGIDGETLERLVLVKSTT